MGKVNIVAGRDGGTDKVVLVARAEVADGFWRRLAGLLARPPLAAGEGLLLRPCRAVHTCFMRYPIDVVFLDGEGWVVGTAERLPPWRLSWVPGAAMALELPAGTLARAGLGRGWQVLLQSGAPQR